MLRKELGSLRNEILALRGEADPSAATSELGVARDHSRAYWRRLSEIAVSEEALQQDAESAFNEGNAANVFAIKGRICRFAAKSVGSIPVEGVDESMVKFGRQLGLWYDRAGELYERATRIWETPSGKQARAELNEEWKRAETQHRNEARLLHERAVAVRALVSRQFGEEFPEFAKPAAPAAAELSEAPASAVSNEDRAAETEAPATLAPTATTEQPVSGSTEPFDSAVTAESAAAAN
jgi:hypothetical protein